jgi:hypothetical protein
VSSEYERVGDAIADAMFGSAMAGRPVYSLPDPATLRSILASAGVDGGDAEALANIVRLSLQIDEVGVAPFRWQAAAAQQHQRQPLEVPPALPLLVLFALAAEQMQADGDLAAHNYYSRVHRLLKVPTASYQRVENNYRHTADLLWGSLNSWLEAWEGERGVPTAYAVGGHAYIGLPMSQAVVRQHDRAGLHELFAMEGMTPGLRIAADDMGLSMKPYATAAPSHPLSSHLARLWRDDSARERIIDAACLELEAWDGSGIERIAATRQVAATRLLTFLRTFPRKSIEFNLMLPYRSEGPDVARFERPAGEVVVPTIAGPGGSTRLSGVGGVSAVSLVDEELDGEFGDDGSRPFGRRPKRVTPLRWDDLQGAYVEVERISLGEDSVVLARADARRLVEGHLAAHARPGWSELGEIPGIPAGWLIFQHVQVVSAPAGQVHFDLLPLAPRSRTSLTLRGGFALPGLLRKWSVLEPPEAIALAAGAIEVEVKVFRGTRIDADALVAANSQNGELAVLPLADCALTDGEYVVAMFVDGASKAASTALLRLRSANTPQFRVEDVDIRLVYSPESSSLWPLSAGPAEWPRFVNGARTENLEPSSDSGPSPIREFVPRTRASRASAQPEVRIGVPMDSESCLLTGKHRIRYPTVRPGQRAPRTIEGECETCGVIKRAAGTPWAATKRDKASGPASTPVEIPPVAESSDPDFEVAFDALNHVGAGSFGTFERIAAQVEGSGLFADSFLRRLEVAGHVDVARDGYLQVSEWAVNTSTLLPIADGRWVLIGSRSQRLLGQLADRLGADGEIVTSVDAELARVEIVGMLPKEGLSDLGIVEVDDSTARDIASALPNLSTIANSLKRVAVPSYRSAEFWDSASASWQPTDSLVPAGAYRLKDFRSTYAIRSASDVENGTIGLGNAQVVKHVANLWSNDPLIGYHSRSASVITPLGADLPAIYGRALSLCSGRAPREVVEHRMLQYPGVPRHVADIVFDRVSR